MEAEKKKIVYSLHSEQAILDMLDYISLNSILAAERIQVEIIEFISSIKKRPTSFPICLELPTRTNAYRYATFYQYKIIFKISSKHILILDVFHSKRNPEHIKKLRRVS